MLKWLIPREARFFDLYNQMAATVLEGTQGLKLMVSDYRHAEEWTKKIKDIEHRGDVLTHEIISLLNQTFVTPFDREDIHQLSHELDEVLDFTDSSAGKMVVYALKKPTPYIKEFCDILVLCAEEVQKVVKELPNLANAEAIRIHCVELNRLENEGDHVMREGLRALFAGKMNAIEVMKLKDIYESLEMAIDKCEDVAGVIESVVVKGA